MEIAESSKQMIRAFAQEFRDNYLLTPKGQWHLSQYQKEKDDIKQNWEAIKIKKSNNQDYFNDVLEKMLPYQDTKHNRDKGYHISVMPAITKDLKVWFENAGWQKAENWPKAGEALFALNPKYSAFKITW